MVKNMFKISIIAHNIEDWLNMGVNPAIVILSIPCMFLIALIVLKFIVSRHTYKCTECDTIFKPKFYKAYT